MTNVNKMIIDKPCNIHKKKLEIEISYFDFETGKKHNEYLDPSKIKEDIILTRNSSISTGIFKLNPNLNIIIVHHGKPTHSIISLEKMPLIFKNQKIFDKVSKYKKRKLAYVFAKGVCSGRIKVLFRLNEKRNNKDVKNILKKMRELDRKLILAKDINEIMAYEGNTAKLFYKGLSKLNEEFNFKRDRFGKDIVNVLLNISRGVLRNRILTRLLIRGISPHNSFLHINHHSNNSLVFDFSEFWIPTTDKLVFYCINKGIIKKFDIDKEGRINKKGLQKICDLIDKRINVKEIDKKIDEFINYLKTGNKFSWKI